MLGFSAVSQTALSALPDEDVSGSASTAQGQTASGSGEVASTTAATGGGYEDDKPRPRRFIQKRGDKLIITTDASAALSAVDNERAAPSKAQEVPEPAAAAKQALGAPAVQEISLAEIRLVAAQYEQQSRVLQMFRQRDWAEMVALYEALRQRQDEDDIEMMLLAL